MVRCCWRSGGGKWRGYGGGGGKNGGLWQAWIVCEVLMSMRFCSRWTSLGYRLVFERRKPQTDKWQTGVDEVKRSTKCPGILR